jgi:hypothetical protein|mmetsp:Transcript_8331/g.12118  ORF Transcript_8331/g.12118 Transcript_8331/m.12118 type:complete len:131 (+) Transcript_8331:44-436(+)
MGQTNWTEDEDVILADSWLFISHDPIKSNQQSGETFWERIFAVFSSKLAKRYGEKAASTRTVTAVQNRWSTMNHDLNGDYCYVSNGHKVVCGMTCRRCRQSCHFDCCEDDEYGFKICASCEKERACDEEV